MNISILGTDYKYIEHSPGSFEFENFDGFCQPLDKEIHVKKKEYLSGSSDSAKYERYKHIVTHELIHAFMEESGRGYDVDEFLVDWIATMFPKINNVLDNILNNYNDSNEENTDKQS
jgi:hypothetical protein